MQWLKIMKNHFLSVKAPESGSNSAVRCFSIRVRKARFTALLGRCPFGKVRTGSAICSQPETLPWQPLHFRLVTAFCNAVSAIHLIWSDLISTWANSHQPRPKVPDGFRHGHGWTMLWRKPGHGRRCSAKTFSSSQQCQRWKIKKRVSFED